MSGVEVIGIVLGAVPLVISALEHYKEGIDVVKDYRDYHLILRSLKTKLTIQEELYRGTLQILLSSELTEYESHALFPETNAHRHSALWGTPEIEAKLRRKLDAKFQIFMDVVVEVSTFHHSNLLPPSSSCTNTEIPDEPNYGATDEQTRH